MNRSTSPSRPSASPPESSGAALLPKRRQTNAARRVLAATVTVAGAMVTATLTVVSLSPVHAAQGDVTVLAPNEAFNSPSGVAVDAAGNVYVADAGNNQIKKIDTTGTVTVLAPSESFSGPGDVAVDAAGKVYVADTGNSVVKVIDTNGSVTTLPGTSASPQGIAVDTVGNVYLSATGAFRVKKIDPSGNPTNLGSSGVSKPVVFNTPRGLAVDADGVVFVAVSGNNEIRRIDTNGVVSILSANVSYNDPQGVAVDAAGNVYIADTANNKIKKRDTAGNVTVVAPNARFSGPTDVAVDATGSNLYVADYENNQIKKIELVSPKSPQTITFTGPATGLVGDTYTPTATATSGLPVDFSIDASASAICALSNGLVAFHAAGTCVVNANQAGNATNEAAPQVQVLIVVSKRSQSITFTGPTTGLVGDSYQPTATSTSGSAVTFTVDPAAAAICTLTNGTVTFNAAGSCVVNANQGGNATYAAAPQAQVVTLSSVRTQTVTFTGPAEAFLGDSYKPAATSSVGLPVTFATDPASQGCSLSAGTVTFITPGTCIIVAVQPGNAAYGAAPSVRVATKALTTRPPFVVPPSTTTTTTTTSTTVATSSAPATLPATTTTTTPAKSPAQAPTTTAAPTTTKPKAAVKTTTTTTKKPACKRTVKQRVKVGNRVMNRTVCIR